jgi:hypothetical protein
MKALALALLMVLSQAREAGDQGSALLPASVIAERIRAMERANAEVRDYTCIFHKREHKGRQLPPESIFMKLRVSAKSVYLRWVGTVSKGREVLWAPGWNDGKLLAHKGSFPDINVSLSPGSKLANTDSRHPVTMAGFSGTIALFASDFRLLGEKPECFKGARDLGEQVVYGAPSHCYEFETDKAACSGLYSYKAQLCIHDALQLPTRVLVWDYEDGQMRLVEEYGYEDIRLNVGLTDRDFDSKNPAYDF